MKTVQINIEGKIAKEREKKGVKILCPHTRHFEF